METTHGVCAPKWTVAPTTISTLPIARAVTLVCAARSVASPGSARRIDSAFLAELVSRHQLDEDEAAEVAVDLTYRLVKQAYKL